MGAAETESRRRTPTMLNYTASHVKQAKGTSLKLTHYREPFPITVALQQIYILMEKT